MNWRNTKEYRIWRISVIRRDIRCVICNSLQNRQAHHMNSGSYFPNDRFNTHNGVTLCRECHINFHTNFKRSFRSKCTRYDFLNFQSLANYFKSIS